MKSSLAPGFWRCALALALPIALQNLLTSCASLIDTAMIIPLGDTAVAAVGIAGRFTFLLHVIAFGFCSGSATLISQFWGVDDRRGIHRVYGVGLCASMLYAFLFAAVTFCLPGVCVGLFGPAADVAEAAASYLSIVAFAIPFIMYAQISCAALRATEKVSVPLLSALLGVITNTSLNYCLISGHLGFPALGIRGAAIATVIGSAVQAVVVFAAIRFGKNAICAPLREYFSFSRTFVLKFARTAAPVLANESLWAIGTNFYVMVFARQGTEEYAGYAIYETIQQLFFVFFVGICHAAAIMIGKEVGRGRRDVAYATASRFFIMTPLLGIVMGTILVLVRNPLLSLIRIETEEARATASALLLFYGLWLAIRMIPYTAVCGIFRAGGDTRTGCILDIVCLYFMGLPLVCLAGLVWHLPFVWIVALMFIGEDAVKGVLCVIHFLRKKWMIKLTDTE